MPLSPRRLYDVETGRPKLYRNDTRYFTRLYGGLGTVSMDFTSSLPAGTDFTRASSGTYFNSSGVIQTASTDVPRFDYYPSTMAARGLLLEGSRTNTLLRSRALTTSPWAVNNVTVTGGVASPVFGDNGAFRVKSSAAAGRVEQLSITTVASQPYYAYAYVSKSIDATMTLRVDNNSAAYAAVCDFDNGTITAQGGGGFGPISNLLFYPVGNGVFFAGFSYTPTSTTTAFRIYPNAMTGEIIVHAAQHEDGLNPSSFILTDGSAVTRAQDMATISDVASALQFNPLEGTVVCAFETTRTVSGTGGWRVFELNDSGNSDYIWSGGGNPIGGMQSGTFVSGITYSGQDGGIPSARIYKMGIAFKAGDNAAYIDGIDRTGSTLANAPIPALMTTMYLGRSTVANRNLFGWLRSMNYYPVRITASQLQAMTA